MKFVALLCFALVCSSIVALPSQGVDAAATTRKQPDVALRVGLHASSSFLAKSQKKTPGTSRPFVFYLGLQKAGSSSFAMFMSQIMRARTLHASEAMYKQIGFLNDGEMACNHTGEGPGPQALRPDYGEILRELHPDRLRSFLDVTSFQAFSDHPWPLIFEWLDQQYPDSKFVLWARNSSEWVDSARAFFSHGAANYPRRMMTLAYGACRVASLTDVQLQRAYEGHVHAVRSYFTGPGVPLERQARFLEFDLAGSLAAKQLCEFVDSGVACDGLSAMPHQNKHLHTITTEFLTFEESL